MTNSIFHVNDDGSINVSATDVSTTSDNSTILFVTGVCDIIHLYTDNVANTPASLFYQGGSFLQPPVRTMDDTQWQPRMTPHSTTEEGDEDKHDGRGEDEDKKEEELKPQLDKLEVTHEGTSRVKKSNVGILTFNYEMFKKKPKRDIKAMFDRFTIIINEVKSYGKTYPNEEVVRKMFRSLSMSWESKVTAIKEVKILETLSLDELVDSFLTHEIRLKKGNKEEKVKKKKRRRLE
ncbi:hypothetical protein J1N35_011769 [Gossypium stocksii]|uniref:UBN2 domain-containing protein n=1 Tax=Gossypium stocksii TaxID=47602 RepID=A0A9D4ADW7_9ROSI|nr:hypothetical protein J1N35_011769 [Gossypium stocksii]